MLEKTTLASPRFEPMQLVFVPNLPKEKIRSLNGPSQMLFSMRLSDQELSL
jgi:hypothetical protein